MIDDGKLAADIRGRNFGKGSRSRRGELQHDLGLPIRRKLKASLTHGSSVEQDFRGDPQQRRIGEHLRRSSGSIGKHQAKLQRGGALGWSRRCRGRFSKLVAFAGIGDDPFRDKRTRRCLASKSWQHKKAQAKQRDGAQGRKAISPGQALVHDALKPAAQGMQRLRKTKCAGQWLRIAKLGSRPQERVTIMVAGGQAASQQEVVATILARSANRRVQKPKQGIEPPNGLEEDLRPVDPKVASAEVRQFMRQDHPDFRFRKPGKLGGRDQDAWAKDSEGDRGGYSREEPQRWDSIHAQVGGQTLKHLAQRPFGNQLTITGGAAQTKQFAPNPDGQPKSAGQMQQHEPGR